MKRVVGLYRKAVDWTNAHPDANNTAPFLVSLREEGKRIALGGITTGHFSRGLKE